MKRDRGLSIVRPPRPESAPDRTIIRPTLVAGARLAVGAGAPLTHRELRRKLGPMEMLAYNVALTIAIAQPTHERRANAVASAIHMAGLLHLGIPLYESSGKRITGTE